MGLDMPLEWIKWVDDIMPGRDNLRILEFFEKDSSWGTAVEGGGWVFQIWSNQFGSWPTEMNWDLKHKKLRCMWGDVSIV